jgi:hypothetical protein
VVVRGDIVLIMDTPLNIAIEKLKAKVATLELLKPFPGAYDELLDHIEVTWGPMLEDEGDMAEDFVFELGLDVTDGILQFEIEMDHSWWCWDPITKTWFNPEDARV